MEKPSERMAVLGYEPSGESVICRRTEGGGVRIEVPAVRAERDYLLWVSLVLVVLLFAIALAWYYFFGKWPRMSGWIGGLLCGIGPSFWYWHSRRRRGPAVLEASGGVVRVVRAENLSRRSPLVTWMARNVPVMRVERLPFSHLGSIVVGSGRKSMSTPAADHDELVAALAELRAVIDRAKQEGEGAH
jgi:hypothetical protein